MLGHDHRELWDAISDGNRSIWGEMTAGIRTANIRAKMLQRQLRRIEEKLFTDEENTAFYMSLANDRMMEMLEDKE